MGLIILLTLLGVGAVIAIGAGIMSYLANRRNSLDRDDRRELDSARVALAIIDDLAYANREIDPNLSVQIIDEIRNHNRRVNNRKELA